MEPAAQPPADAAERPSRRSTAAVAAAIVALTVAVYAATLGGGFLNWDDHVYITENAELRLPFADAVRSVFTTFLTANWNPLQRLTYVMEWHTFGENATAFRVTNLVLHAASSVVVLLVLSEWLRNRAAAAFAAAAFAVHPANVENVAWISERKTLLASLFAFLAVLAWLRADGDRRGRVAAIALFAVGLLAKTSIVVLPGLLLLLDLSLRRAPAWRWYGAMAAVAAPVAFVQVRAAAAFGAIEAPHGGSLWTHAATCAAALPRYVGSVIAPFALVPRHLFDPVTSAGDPRFLLGLALLVVLAWGTWRSWRGERRLFVAAPWFVASVLLTVIVPIPIVQADRYLYLSLPFLLGGAFAGLADRFDGSRVPAKWVMAGLVAALAACAANYALAWRTSTSLWTCQLERHPQDPAAWHSLAVARVAEAADGKGARACYAQVLAIDPLFPNAPEGMALLDVSEGHAADAERAMAALVRDHPDRPLAWSVLSAAQEKLGRPADAQRTLLDGLGHVPGDAHLAENLSRLRERNPGLGVPPPR